MPEASATVDLSATMSPEQATTALNQMSAALQPAPAPLSPSTPHEAEVRLAELSNNVEWYRKLMSGSLEARREFDRLNGLKAGVTATDPLTEQIADTTIGDQSVTRAGLVSWAEDARARGFSDEAIYHFVNGGTFTPETVALAQFWLPRMQNDETLLCPDFPADYSREYQMECFQWVLSAGTMGTP